MRWLFALIGRKLSDDEIVANALIEAFRSRRVVKFDFNPLGISELTVCFRNSNATASWYGSGNARSLVVEGQCFPGSSRLAQRIVDAARMRGDHLLSEKLFTLRAKLDADAGG